MSSVGIGMKWRGDLRSEVGMESSKATAHGAGRFPGGGWLRGMLPIYIQAIMLAIKTLLGLPTYRL